MELAHLLVDTILDKKGEDVLLLDIRQESILTDFFLFCNGDNARQIKALAEGIATDARDKADTRPRGVEGEPESGWVLLDFGDLVVHVFDPDRRRYYNLEELWSRGQVLLRMQ